MLLLPRYAGATAGLLVCALFVIWALFVLALLPPYSLIEYAARRWHYVLWRVPTRGRRVALTIDDVPGPHFEALLGVLQHHNAACTTREARAHATFFVIADFIKSKRDAELLVQAVHDGHELANHDTENVCTSARSGAQMATMFTQWRDRINSVFSAAGTYPPPVKWHRPGHGFFNARLHAAATAARLNIALGNVYPLDGHLGWLMRATGRLGVSVASMLCYTLVSMRTSPGDIVVMHNGPHLPSALAGILNTRSAPNQVAPDDAGDSGTAPMGGYVRFSTLSELWADRAAQPLSVAELKAGVTSSTEREEKNK